MTKISVILPIYNGAATLAKTLNSLLDQTYSDFEIIACIDGSTDASEQILNDYSSKFGALTILKNHTNRGLGPTMNRLISHAKGQYIAIAEQDDFYYSYRLQLQAEVLDNNLSIGLVSGIAEFWNGEQVNTKFPGLLVKGEQYPESETMFMLNYKHQIKVVNSCMMFRKAVHIDHGLYFTQHYPSISVDWAYILRFSLISKIHGIHEILVRLDRRTERHSVTTNKEKQFKATRELLRSFAYEYPQFITPKDYNYAIRTQNLMEINSKYGIKYLISWMYYFIKNPLEKRYISSLKKRVLQKKKIYFN